MHSLRRNVLSLNTFDSHSQLDSCRDTLVVFIVSVIHLDEQLTSLSFLFFIDARFELLDEHCQPAILLIEAGLLKNSILLQSSQLCFALVELGC